MDYTGAIGLSHVRGILMAMATTWRLKAARGYGWVERVDQAGRCTVTADPMGAHQWPTREAAEDAQARLRPGLVPVVPLEGRAFTRRTHGAA